MAGCDGGSATAQTPAPTQPTTSGSAAAQPQAGAAKDGCPTEAEIAAVIGSPVKRLKGIGCSYQAEDESDVSILIAAAGSADQLLSEMRETASAFPDAKVEQIQGVGERAHMFATTGRASAVAVNAGKAFFVEISANGGPNKSDRKPQVIQVLRLLMR
jgi:hypothetical protein